LVQALRYAKGKQVNIYTDSNYAFATRYGANILGKRTADSRGKEIKNKEEILQLLQAVWELSQVAVMHCRRHQRGTDYVSRGNCLADQAARKAAEELSSPEAPKQTAKLLLALELSPATKYTKEKEQWAKDERGTKRKGRLVEVA
jgi:ribonuclease HI